MTLRRWMVIVATAALIITLRLIFRPYRIPTRSMEPAVPAGSYVIANRLAYTFGGPARGDMIVYRHTDGKVWLMKRVIGLPGESIAIAGKRVLINGWPLYEPYVVHRDSRVYPPNALAEKEEPFPGRDWMDARRLGAGEYFVMGDNRDFSNDSRFVGPWRRKSILGRVITVLKPLSWWRERQKRKAEGMTDVGAKHR